MIVLSSIKLTFWFNLIFVLNRNICCHFMQNQFKRSVNTKLSNVRKKLNSLLWKSKCYKRYIWERKNVLFDSMHIVLRCYQLKGKEIRMTNMELWNWKLKNTVGKNESCFGSIMLQRTKECRIIVLYVIKVRT